MLKTPPDNEYLSRFREVVSDPLNNLINRVPAAGYRENNFIILHNGNKIPYGCYYGNFSDILIINRGVHEPLEEFCFQELLKILNDTPIMIELGAYWAHYSMWLKKIKPSASCILVEPDVANLKIGEVNFSLNGYTGTFINQFVSKTGFKVEDYMKNAKIQKLDVLHSDIQGYEIEMLEDTSHALNNKLIDYLFISTHSNNLHYQALSFLSSKGYRIEVSSDLENHTTSLDGFILASSPLVLPVFPKGFSPLGRVDICKSNSNDLLQYLNKIS